MSLFRPFLPFADTFSCQLQVALRKIGTPSFEMVSRCLATRALTFVGCVSCLHSMWGCQERLAYQAHDQRSSLRSWDLPLAGAAK